MFRKIMFYTFAFLFVYFIIGGIIFNHIFPPQKPVFTDYFQEKPSFQSSEEGMMQEVKKLENDWLHLKVTLQPKAAGPPEHIHESFDEFFYVEKGTVSLLINGNKKTLKAGESILIPKGTPHKPFNETTEEVIINDASNQHPTMPCLFGYHLTQLYPTMDKYGAKSPKVLLKLAALGNSCDTWVADAPMPIQKTIRWLLGPTARILL